MNDVRYFSNNRGISIIRNEFTYGGTEGLYEIAVVAWWTDKKGNKDHAVDYSTEITDDVIGHLTMEDVEKIAERIKKLSPRDNKKPHPLELRNFIDHMFDDEENNDGH
tara:strand:+ start:764 stop:1087 length:324 start_codon:yes stop_codon:yes gene_type:complete